VGSISVTANIAPKLCADFQKSSKIDTEEGQNETVRLDKILQPIHSSMFIESNPSPVKYGAKLLGLCDDDVRLPLVKTTEPTKEAVKKALVSANLL
jgi:4-hydroxy-tetrahydrodipicolinate synthase